MSELTERQVVLLYEAEPHLRPALYDLLEKEIHNLQEDSERLEQARLYIEALEDYLDQLPFCVKDFIDVRNPFDDEA